MRKVKVTKFHIWHISLERIIESHHFIKRKNRPITIFRIHDIPYQLNLENTLGF